jgi:hypothetical protein
VDLPSMFADYAQLKKLRRLSFMSAKVRSVGRRSSG